MILQFLFIELQDLVACSMVCRFMNFAASDESLWRRLLVSFPSCLPLKS